MFFDLSEQEIDGETLLMLCMTGTTDQLKACGLETVKDQLKLKKTDSGFRENKCGGSNRTSGLRYKLY